MGRFRNWYAVALLSLAFPSVVAAQRVDLDDLSDEEFKALERTNLGSVTATISFLASDEMGGRGTPSPELDIAAAYVAARLRGAGAEGLGPDGSFYLESSIKTLRTPSSGVQFSAGDRRPPRAELYAGASDPVEFKGSIPFVEPRGGKQVDGPVAIKSTADARIDARALRQYAGVFAGQGATALLVMADEDDPLWSVAESMQQRARVDSPRGQFAIPVMIVAGPEWGADMGCTLKLPANIADEAIVRNVIGVIRGSDEELSKEAIIFTAHLDHLGRGGPGEDTVYNGADDDASGVTAVLTLADTYGALAEKPKRSVIFMTFWGEERGLLGSRQFVEESPWPLETVVANINIEMVGRPEEGARNKMWMTGWTESDLGQLMAEGSRRVGVETFEHKQFSPQLYRASDNYAFVQKGVVAHSFSAGSLHDDYHGLGDHWEKLDLPHMTQVIRGLFAGSLPIANGVFTPEQSDD